MSAATSIDAEPTEPGAARPLLGYDRRASIAFRAIAVFGVVVALVGSVVGWRFLTTLDRDLEQSLTIGEDAAATLVDTIDVADEVIGDLDAGLATLDRTLDTVAGTTDDTSGVAASAAEIAGRLPENFDDVDAALGTVESLSGAIDSALRTASRIPLGPDYDPDTPLPDAIADVRAAFGPIGADLGELADRLDGFADGTGELTADLDDVRADLDRTRTSLSASEGLLDRYRASALEAEQLARDSRSDFEGALRWTRVVLILLGVFVVAAQYVPWYLGRHLGGGVPDHDVRHPKV
ncbi:MAG: hypothetical protein KDB37_07005 [Ilumatobacter sp.]|nr:hypothetical protein [Ilumatobacter sp.]